MVDERGRGPRGGQAGRQGPRQLGGGGHRPGRPGHQERRRLPARPGDEERRGPGREGHVVQGAQRRRRRLLHGPRQVPLPTSDKNGNFTLAAHRDGHGAKFHNIDKLNKGDSIVYETKDNWYVYKVYAILPETSKYNVKVLQSVPKQSGKTKPGHYITLTTCTPVYTSRYRYVVWGELERVDKVDSDRTPPKELR